MEQIKHCNGIYMHSIAATELFFLSRCVARAYHFFYIKMASFKSFGAERAYLCPRYVCLNHNIDRKIDLYANTPAINHIVRLLSFEISLALALSLLSRFSLFFTLSLSHTHTFFHVNTHFFFSVCLLNFRFQVCESNLHILEMRENPFSTLLRVSTHTLKWRIEFIWILIIIYTFIQSNISSKNPNIHKHRTSAPNGTTTTKNERTKWKHMKWMHIIWGN